MLGASRLFLAALLTLAGCASTGRQGASGEALAGKPVILCPEGTERSFTPSQLPPERQVSIQRVREEGRTLRVTVTYLGGCGSHGLDLCWNSEVLTSSPGQVRLMLLHDPQGDTCQEAVTEELAFDTALLTRGGWALGSCEAAEAERRRDVVGCFYDRPEVLDEHRRR